MQPRNVVLVALVLAAILAGVLIYMVNPSSENKNATATPSPTGTPIAFFSPAPVIFDVPTSPVPRISDVGARTTATPSRVQQVNPTAKTGPAEVMWASLITMITSGGAGLAWQLRRLS